MSPSSGQSEHGIAVGPVSRSRSEMDSVCPLTVIKMILDWLAENSASSKQLDFCYKILTLEPQGTECQLLNAEVHDCQVLNVDF
jgi:hypothetical protein